MPPLVCTNVNTSIPSFVWHYLYGTTAVGSTQATRQFRGQHLGQAPAGCVGDPEEAAHCHQPGGAVPCGGGPVRPQDGRQAVRQVSQQSSNAATIVLLVFMVRQPNPI